MYHICNNIIFLLLIILLILLTNSYCYLINCNDDESIFLSSVFKNIGWMMDYSGCPNDPWIKDFAEMTGHDDQFHLLMNVGFNKGYNFAQYIHTME